MNTYFGLSPSFLNWFLRILFLLNQFLSSSQAICSCPQFSFQVFMFPQSLPLYTLHFIIFSHFNSRTKTSKLFLHIPLFHTRLFLLSFATSMTTSFPGLFTFFSFLFLLLFLFQLFNLGQCQLHSISACLGNVYCLDSSSSCFLCVICSFLFIRRT